MKNEEIVLFETSDKEVTLSVPIEEETVWLNRNQMAELFGRDVKTIGKHINNALKEELSGQKTGAAFKGSIETIYQRFAGEDLYPTLKEKAENLLYFLLI